MHYYLGIDGGKNTGLAVWNATKKCFESITTTDFWGAIGRIYNYNLQHDLTVVIEDVSANKSHWHKGANMKSQSKIGENIGRVKRETELLIEYCKRNDIDYIAVKPTKNSLTKLSQEQFVRITGWKGGQLNSHGRDAAGLIFGR